MRSSDHASCRLGLVALGDSITVGEGNMVCGIPCRSWALWLAQALDLPFTSYAVNGAVVADVLREQLPAVRVDYDVGCVYAGVNDVRQVDWDAQAYERDLESVARGLAERCARVLLLTIPLDLGRPPAGAKVGEADAAIRRVGEATGATVCELTDLAGWPQLRPDTVHPTALGQIEMADRAWAALGGAAPGRRPSELAGGIVLGPRGRASYARTHARMLMRDVVRRRLEAIRA
jgi:lysophospholipase L1-like esterase